MYEIREVEATSGNGKHIPFFPHYLLVGCILSLLKAQARFSFFCGRICYRSVRLASLGRRIHRKIHFPAPEAAGETFAAAAAAMTADAAAAAAATARPLGAACQSDRFAPIGTRLALYCSNFLRSTTWCIRSPNLVWEVPHADTLWAISPGIANSPC